MALSDSDVDAQIKHMMGFIEQEANEKAEEIDAKAEEEFNIEKGRLVQNQRIKIMEYFDRKEKQVELQKKIQQSNMANAARLRVLKAQDDHVRNVLEESKKQLAEVTKNRDAYERLLRDLITQGIFQLLETSVVVRCKRGDLPLVEKVAPEAVSLYKEQTRKECNITIDKDSFLPDAITGGVELLVMKGKIKISNTLENRLEMIARQMVPETRTMLFGKNVNRKFMD